MITFNIHWVVVHSVLSYPSLMASLFCHITIPSFCHCLLFIKDHDHLLVLHCLFDVVVDPCKELEGGI